MLPPPPPLAGRGLPRLDRPCATDAANTAWSEPVADDRNLRMGRREITRNLNQKGGGVRGTLRRFLAHSKTRPRDKQKGKLAGMKGGDGGGTRSSGGGPPGSLRGIRQDHPPNAPPLGCTWKIHGIPGACGWWILALAGVNRGARGRGDHEFRSDLALARVDLGARDGWILLFAWWILLWPPVSTKIHPSQSKIHQQKSRSPPSTHQDPPQPGQDPPDNGKTPTPAPRKHPDLPRPE